MNLVNELQVSVERDDVLSVLRKARRLASKLGVDDINHWLRCEQEGYERDATLPNYRTVTGTLSIKTNGYIPAGMGYVVNGVIDYPGGFVVPNRMPQPMSQIVQMAAPSEKSDNFVTVDERLVAGFRSRMDPDFAHQMTFLLRLNIDQIRSIPDAVKDRILDWALELERRGVLGENMTFNDDEKQKAHTINFNLQNCTIEQLNNMGKNARG